MCVIPNYIGSDVGHDIIQDTQSDIWYYDIVLPARSDYAWYHARHASLRCREKGSRLGMAPMQDMPGTGQGAGVDMAPKHDRHRARGLTGHGAMRFLL